MKIVDRVNRVTAPEGFVTVCCRLCNEPWFLPEQYVDQFNANHSFECPHCRSSIMRKSPINMLMKEKEQ